MTSINRWVNTVPTTVDANGNAVAVSSASPLPVSTSQGAPAAANILNGFQTFTATTVATTLLTIPAGRTWVGQVGVACAVEVAAAATTAGQARGVVAVAGTGATPAAGTVFAVEAKAGANAATGTVGTSGNNHALLTVAVVAPSGNAVTVTVTTTISPTQGVVDAFAVGSLI